MGRKRNYKCNPIIGEEESAGEGKERMRIFSKYNQSHDRLTKYEGRRRIHSKFSAMEMMRSYVCVLARYRS